MPPHEAALATQAIVEAQDRYYQDHALEWSLEQVSTVDEAANAVLPFPDRMYIRDLFQALETQKLLAIAKSRRMFVTWAVATFLTHRIRYRKNFAGFVQSETEGKAAFVIDKRMAFIEDNINPIYRREYKSHKTVQGAIGQMTYLKTGSFAKALAQGGDAFRTYTPSFVFMDEIESMEQGHQSFVAALPFAEKACQIILCSSSKGPHGVLADLARSVGFTRF